MSKSLVFTPKHPLCYMHLPKTGGTTLREFIVSALPNHKYYKGVSNHGNPNPNLSTKDKYTVFLGHIDQRFWDGNEIQPQFITVLRSPSDRIVSLYHYWRSHGFQHIYDNWGNGSMAKFCKRNSLKAFVTSKNFGIGCYMFNAQARQLSSGHFQHWHGTDEELLIRTLKMLYQYKVVGTTDKLDEMMGYLGEKISGTPVKFMPRLNTNISLKEKFPKSYSPKPQSIPSEIEGQITSVNIVDSVIFEWAEARWVNGEYLGPGEYKIGLEDAKYRLKELKLKYGITVEASSQCFYYGHNSCTNSGSDRLMFMQKFGLNFEYLDWPIRCNSNTYSGRQIQKISKSNGAHKTHIEDSDDTTISIGPHNAVELSVEYLKNTSNGKLKLGSPIRMLEWYSDSMRSTGYCGTEFEPTNSDHLLWFKTLHNKLARELKNFFHVERDLDYLSLRYTNHTFRDYLAKIFIDRQTNQPVGLVFLSRRGNILDIMDYIGAFKNLDQVVCQLLVETDKNITSVRFAMPENFVAKSGIVAPGNFATKFYPVSLISQSIFSSHSSYDVYITMGDSMYF